MMESKDKDTIVHYYNREKRLERADSNARFMVDHYNAKRPGLLRTLTATRSLRFMFFVVLLAMVAVGVANLLVGGKNSGSVAGVHLSAAAMWFEGHVYVTVKRDEPAFSFFTKNQARLPVGIRAGDGISYATGIMQAAEDECRIRFPAEANPGRIAIIASVSRGEGEVDSNLELVAMVE